MTPLFEPSAEQEAGYVAWCQSRPEAIRAVAERFRPWRIYRLKETGQFVRARSFCEPEKAGQSVTMTIAVLACVENLGGFEYGVFGVSPDSLEQVEAPEVVRAQRYR